MSTFPSPIPTHPGPGSEGLASASDDPLGSGERLGIFGLDPGSAAQLPGAETALGFVTLKRERAGEREGARGGLLGACPDCGAARDCRPGPAEPPDRAALLPGGRGETLQA